MFSDQLAVVCTEKDAVKLLALVDLTHVWALRIELGFACDMNTKLDALLSDKGIAPHPGSEISHVSASHDGACSNTRSFGSTRLPGKPLVDIGGQPMVVRVAQQAARSVADDVVVAVDDQRVATAVEAAGFTAAITILSTL